MNPAIATIDQYIASCPGEHRGLLKKLRQLILKAAPEETTETISYKMPAFRYHGNLIHYALGKNHLGIYPGSHAIEHYAEQLGAYKISKGAIRLPLDKPLPRQLIIDLVRYNAAMLKDKAGPNWHISRGNWDEAYEFMEQLIARCDLVKNFKWGSDIYTYNNRNIIAWGGFKAFFSLWFYNGVFLEDKAKVLVSASEGKTKALRQWRFTNVANMKKNEKKILAYISESIRTVKEGKEIKPERSIPKQAAGLLKDALNSDKIFKAAFEKLTPGRQKEYIAYIDDARQEKTKLSRIDKIKPMILEGAGLNDKYKK